jgi:His-Xaa-Ser system protein HxsD
VSDQRNTTVVFDRQVFAVDTVKKAAYRYIDRFTVDFDLSGSALTCTLSFPRGTSDEAATRLADEFKKEVLDQDLRERIKAETAPIRNLILAHAFSKTGLIADEQVPKD